LYVDSLARVQDIPVVRKEDLEAASVVAHRQVKYPLLQNLRKVASKVRARMLLVLLFPLQQAANRILWKKVRCSTAAIHSGITI
jgi:hypothetical protein